MSSKQRSKRIWQPFLPKTLYLKNYSPRLKEGLRYRLHVKTPQARQTLSLLLLMLEDKTLIANIPQHQNQMYLIGQRTREKCN